MKKLFIAAIPICLVSYIIFGISTAILGTRWRSEGNNSGTYDDYGMTSYIDKTVSGISQWTLTEVMPNVTLQTSGVNAYVIQSVDEYIHLYVCSPTPNKIAVKAEHDNDTLKLEVHPPEITFGDIINFGQILWSEDIFHGSPSAEVVIAFPKLIYDSLEVQHGSGIIMIDGFNAERNDFDIGSGRFEFSKSEQYISSFFNVDLGSGIAIISNMQTRGYRIDIGSGKFDFNGLSGIGDINMGSGKGNIAYADSPEYRGDLNMGSGNLSIFLPDEYGCALEMEFGSGSIDVDAYGKKETFREDDCIDLGNADGSGSGFNIDMGSGKVYVRNSSAYTAPTMFEGRPDNVEELGMIKGIVIDGDGTVASTSYNAGEEPVYSATIVEGGTAIFEAPSFEFTSSSILQDQSGNAGSGSSVNSSSSSADMPPEVPEDPSASTSPSAEQTAA